jgi:hypothetical protein
MPNVNQKAAIIQKQVQVGSVPQNPSTPNPSTPVAPVEITKFQFRKLFTQSERVTIDNIQYNQNFSGTVKAVIATSQKDMEVSNVVVLNSADVIAGVQFLASIGIITPERATRILANQPPL